jgi:glycine/serine hydroxymethyltransferase
MSFCQKLQRQLRQEARASVALKCGQMTQAEFEGYQSQADDAAQALEEALLGDYRQRLEAGDG